MLYNIDEGRRGSAVMVLGLVVGGGGVVRGEGV